MRMSKAFSMDKTSTGVASSLAKYFIKKQNAESNSRIKANKSNNTLVLKEQECSPMREKNSGIPMHLAVNPCSNTTLTTS